MRTSRGLFSTKINNHFPNSKGKKKRLTRNDRLTFSNISETTLIDQSVDFASLFMQQQNKFNVTISIGINNCISSVVHC